MASFSHMARETDKTEWQRGQSQPTKLPDCDTKRCLFCLNPLLTASSARWKAHPRLFIAFVSCLKLSPWFLCLVTIKHSTLEPHPLHNIYLIHTVTGNGHLTAQKTCGYCNVTYFNMPTTLYCFFIEYLSKVDCKHDTLALLYQYRLVIPWTLMYR